MAIAVVRSLNALGGTAPITRFSDDFLTAPRSNSIGTPWEGGTFPLIPIVNPPITSQPTVGACSFAAGNALKWINVHSGNPATQWLAFFQPSVLNHSLVSGKSQFAQMKCMGVNRTGSEDIQAGVSAFCGYGQGYNVTTRATDRKIFLEKWNQSSTSSLFASAAATFVDGDTLTVQVTVVAAGNNSIAVYRNSTLLTTVTDNVAALDYGIPGINAVGSQSGGVPTSEWRFFVGGIGTII